MSDYEFDPSDAIDYDDEPTNDHAYCPVCGHDWPGCGCPGDMNTWTLRGCKGCGAQWWDSHGTVRATCWKCASADVETKREPLYAANPLNRRGSGEDSGDG